MKAILLVLLALISQAYANDNPYSLSQDYDKYQTSSSYSREQKPEYYWDSPEYLAQKQRHWQEEMQHQQMMQQQMMQNQRRSDCMFNNVCY
jgi:hypothetical protein